MAVKSTLKFRKKDQPNFSHTLLLVYRISSSRVYVCWSFFQPSYALAKFIEQNIEPIIPTDSWNNTRNTVTICFFFQFYFCKLNNRIRNISYFLLDENLNLVIKHHISVSTTDKFNHIISFTHNKIILIILKKITKRYNT